MTSNRIDLLSELDVVWKKRYGFRVSGAGWFDDAYGNKSARNPALAVPPSYIGQNFSNTTKRFYHGPSGEILDAFVFGGAARLRYHGVSRIIPRTAPSDLVIDGRINLTFRQFDLA